VLFHVVYGQSYYTVYVTPLTFGYIGAKCYQELKKVKLTLEKDKKRTEIQEKIPACNQISGRKTYIVC